eukprot:TRINITY_DN34125_c0_g1_i1.p1 TRINITY_DN34125_c0_g1~~TRINITY_DN34125_c0_g1_i1.p1  ORF type:complete len:230 (+),score=3.14 TRINITY_DN34125_c0_g1_i1:52-741(+)
MAIVRKRALIFATLAAAVSLNLQGCGEHTLDRKAPSLDSQNDSTNSNQKNTVKTSNMFLCLNSMFECRGDARYCATWRPQCEQARLVVSQYGGKKPSVCVRAQGSFTDGMNCQRIPELSKFQAVTCQGDALGALMSDDCVGSESWCTTMCRRYHVGCRTYFRMDDNAMFAFGSKESCSSIIKEYMPSWDFNVQQRHSLRQAWRYRQSSTPLAATPVAAGFMRPASRVSG